MQQPPFYSNKQLAHGNIDFERIQKKSRKKPAGVAYNIYFIGILVKFFMKGVQLVFDHNNKIEYGYYEYIYNRVETHMLLLPRQSPALDTSWKFIDILLSFN